MTPKLLAAALAACALLAGCALPQIASVDTAPKSAATHRAHAAATKTAPPASPLAALTAIIQNCAAGAGFPGQRHPLAAFRVCLGVMDVPVSPAGCAVRVFRQDGTQGAEAVGLGFRRECGKTITERKNPR